MNVQHVCHKGQKGASDPLELMVMLRTEPHPLPAQHTLLIPQLSLQHPDSAYLVALSCKFA